MAHKRQALVSRSIYLHTYLKGEEVCLLFLGGVNMLHSHHCTRREAEGLIDRKRARACDVIPAIT